VTGRGTSARNAPARWPRSIGGSNYDERRRVTMVQIRGCGSGVDRHERAVAPERAPGRFDDPTPASAAFPRSGSAAWMMAVISAIARCVTASISVSRVASEQRASRWRQLTPRYRNARPRSACAARCAGGLQPRHRRGRAARRRLAQRGAVGAIEHIADAARLRGIYPWRGPLQSVTVAVPSA
jgi:hypothetical protein